MTEEKPLPKSSRYFFVGCMVGFFGAIAFGLFTYPWSNPQFEGGGGLHFFAMLIITPLATFITGFVFLIVGEIRKSVIKQNSKHK